MMARSSRRAPHRPDDAGEDLELTAFLRTQIAAILSASHESLRAARAFNRREIDVKIEARKALPAPSSDAIKNLEATIKVNLPQEHIDLLGTMNGAYLQGNIFDIPGAITQG
ncbi:hypothetical protein BLA50215_03543 [Burkholderia lata]|uniref:SMI1/KNR4 family protein n=1 Tax=Burkholderia lata (strain ATCC 17760 / DSM 23089 / LMG 22485 / NCIMB 9086 / R18194 / 383) TaxID=482957 RepID=UPI001453CE8C|nr:SMI1/KNR4 family protein [Burkholderia lata]VWD15607.1 hypothetical protein BLA50215_03543 [Burkholderia lata]